MFLIKKPPIDTIGLFCNICDVYFGD